MAKVEAEVRLITRNIALRDRRKELGHTQRSLGESVGLPATMITEYETLKKWPGAPTQEKIAVALEWPIEALFPPELEAIVRPGTFRMRQVVEQQQIEAFYEKHTATLLPPAPDEVLQTIDLDRAKESLTDREREVVDRVFAGETLEVVADLLGLSRERIRQIKERALGKLRNPKHNLLSSYYSP